MADKKRVTCQEEGEDAATESKTKRIRTSTCLRLARKSVDNSMDPETIRIEPFTETHNIPSATKNTETIFNPGNSNSFGDRNRSKNCDTDSLLNKVKEIKQNRRNKSDIGVQSRFQDAQISMEQFSQSLRSLDTVCDIQEPPKQSSQTEPRLGFVSFREFQNSASPEEENLAENCQPIVHLSFDEDNEEDMFEDAKDEPEAGDKSDLETCFHGFSSDESQHSKNAAARFSQRQELQECEDSECQDCNGFSPMEQKNSHETVRNWYSWLVNYEPAVDSELSHKQNDRRRDYDGRSLESPRIRELKNLEAPKRSNEKKNQEMPSIKTDNVVVPFLNEIRTNTNQLRGFSTASGRKISISETAIQRAQEMYKEIEQLELGEEMKNAEKCNSLETIKISKTSGSKEHDLFDESLDEIIGNLIEPEQEIKNEPGDESSERDRRVSEKEITNNICLGFETARGGKLKISKEALAKAQAQFEEIQIDLANKILEIDSKNHEESSNKNNSWNNKSFGGQETKIPKQGFPEEKSDNNETKNESNEHMSKITSQRSNEEKADNKIESGFKTAKGDHLKISREAISRAKAQLEEIDKEINENSTPKHSRIIVEEEKHDLSCGLSTAGGGSSKISKKPISKANGQLDEINKELSGDSTPKNVEIATVEKKFKFNGGFSTAGGREIKISEEALEKAKAQFQDVENEVIKNLSQRNSKIDSPKLGASSASSAQTPSAEESFAVELCNFESLEFEDFVMDESEASKKRKFEEIDDDTPIRKDPWWKRKKGRSTSDLQGRKLFDEKLANISIVGQVEPEKELISEDIDASAAALIEDEERSKKTLKSESRFVLDAGTPLEIKDCSKNVEISCKSTKASNPPNSILSFPSEIPTSNLNSEEQKGVDSHGESIPDDLNFESQFSQDQSQAQVINKFMMEMMKMMETRSAMTSKQDETIRAKRTNKPQACDGSLYQLRTSKRDSRFSWRELTENEAPVPREHSGSSLESEIFSVTADSAPSYSFCCVDFYGGTNARINVEGIKVGDDAFLILDERNCAGAREFERAFLASPGVDPKLVPAGWVKNHYGWIVWKLASMDRVKFGHKCLPRMLTPNRVMLELKYRYDREIYRTQWPPLRRILEKSEDATGRLVLCVASITSEDNNKTPAKGPSTSSPSILGSATYKMTLTDGWYSIPASTDIAMINCIKSGKIKEGTKIVTFGATAMNLDQGCSVLEIPDCVSLKIHTNSTRRARWDTKLDFYRANRGPMPLSLKSVKSNGGVICKLVVAISRSYPVLYREKLPDGQFVFRNARCDEEAARAHEARCQSKMEEICENVSREFQFGLESKNQEDEIRRKIAEKLKECLPPPRDVTPVQKIRIAEGEASAMMTIWSSSRETDQMFEEGSSIVIFNSFASGQRCNELQITAGRNTVFNRESTRQIKYPERIYTSLMDVGEAGFNPVYGEFDTVGVVTSTGPAPHGMKNFETVNLACPRSESEDTSDFLSILFWQGVSTHGYSKILTVGTLIACSNLEWRRNTSRSIPMAYCTERSVFTKNPRQKHLVKPFESLRDMVKDPFAYATRSGSLIEEEIAKKTPLRVAANGTPYRIGGPYNPTTPGSSSRDSIVGSIDIGSTPKNNSRKASIMRRIEKLEAYGEPPKLPPISMNHSSPKVLSHFLSPVFTPVTKS